MKITECKGYSFYLSKIAEYKYFTSTLYNKDENDWWRKTSRKLLNKSISCSIAVTNYPWPTKTGDQTLKAQSERLHIPFDEALQHRKPDFASKFLQNFYSNLKREKIPSLTYRPQAKRKFHIIDFTCRVLASTWRQLTRCQFPAVTLQNIDRARWCF